METLIHIEVASIHDTTYSHDILQWVKQELPKVVTFDFDNFSEPSICDYAIDLLKQSRKVGIIIHVKNDQPLGTIRKFIDFVVRKNDAVYFLALQGDQKIIEKMAKPLGQRFHKNADFKLQKELLLSSFNHQSVA
ncbi:hypothetical protein [Xanthovirga aplysinae]|uniref:hypothetical protein n=1 Tax=Xanthovirga aplysinae TaxID=2529853 RepID=UPI0012BD5F6F|nr:hypothetical protein [Xanthovirga aplysinae]MTI31643.1 hypothetical protein [Xanthovirga aplysinae]